MNLPPEIKSAEDFCADLANKHPNARPLIWPSDYLELVRQRDLTIWNAAIEKGNKVEPLKGFADQFDSDAEIHAYLNGWRSACEAILNLKRKEWCESTI